MGRPPGERLLIPQRGADGGMQVHQLPVPGEPGVTGAPGLQARPAQYIGDRFHHQLVFAPVLVGASEQVSAGTNRCGAG